MTRAQVSTEALGESLFQEGWQLLDSGKEREGFLTLSRAAKLGHVEAQQAVGYLYDVGRGVRRSVAKALRWYRKAARAGDAAAASNLGLFYSTCNMRRTAMRWFQRALELGNDDVLLEMARLSSSSPAGRRYAVRYLRRLLRRKNVAIATLEESRTLLAELRAKKGF